ncbi:uncharacterized protein LOC116765750 isoform X2 [Danaus plexippus]|uniref:uncharacterized protein LOC116765750 isoform X2 n=1 Tax=Danaus plexippus TaxID=13037 RepID=UPI002AB057D3|nr:uncharacterized protein LOC116765750 isoform X2 [Danaus plexippus]
MFAQDKSSCYFEEDKYFVPEKNTFTPTPIDFTVHEYDKSSNFQEIINYVKNKLYKLEPTSNDLITLAYDERFTDIQENKHFVKKKNKYEPTPKDLTTLAYEKSVNNLHEIHNFVPTKNEYRVTPNDLPMLEYEKIFNIQEDTTNIKKKYKASPTFNDDTMFANDENSNYFKQNKNCAKKKKKVTTTFKNQATFKYDEGFNNLKESKTSDQKPYIFRPTSDLTMSPYDKNFEQKKYKFKPSHNDLTMFKNGKNSEESKVFQPVRHFNDYKDVNIKRPVTKVNTPPKQYYSTPIPMKNADFNKFLKNLDIDVESVTAPLSDPLPKRIDAWNLFKKNVTGLISKQQKILENYERFKTKEKNKKILDRPLVYDYFHPNPDKLNNNNSKVMIKSNKPTPLQTQKNSGGDKKSNKNSQRRLSRKKNAKIITNDERLLKLKKNSMVFATSESFDLFQLNDPKKQPIKSNKIGNIDVTLNNYNRNSSLGMHNLLLTKNVDDPNNLQLVTMKSKTSKTSNKNDFYFRNMYNYGDHLPFTHIPAKNITTKAEYNQLYKFINKKKKLSQTIPSRVQISGHSYKYDIIYQTPMNYWMQDLDTYDMYPTYNFNKSTYSEGYKDYYPGMTTNIKYENMNRLRFYRKDNFEQCINTTHMASKAEENFTSLDPLSTNYTLTPTGKILKSNFSKATKNFKKYFYIALKEPKNIDDVVYFEPPLRSQIKKKKEQKPTCKNKVQKRGIQSKDAFTAKGVAALEVVVDLVKSTDTLNNKELRNALPDMEEKKNAPYILTAPKTENHATNSIQVHIALPNDLSDRKRSLEPIKVRKVFSAVMSTPVDLEYQIHTFEDDKVTKMSQEVISPGLYLLVENINITSPTSNFALKPIRNIGISNLISFENNTYKNYINTLINGNVSNATINPDIITTVYSQLVKRDENMNITNETKPKRYIKDVNYNKIKRGVSWDKLKRYFDHERVCNCRCKINKTMCKPCAASDAVISELIFEFDNLVNYVTDHCTEIQTFFWMNPTGGRKLKDSVHKLDTTLNNYYKRLNDKCRGKTCQMISTSIDKRECHKNYPKGKLLNHLQSLDVKLKNIVENNVFDENVFKTGKMCISSINKCINTKIKRNFNKRSFKASAEDINRKSFYTLNNVKVNLICDKDLTAYKKFGPSSNITKVMTFEDNVKTPLYFDVDEIKREKKKGKVVKQLFKKLSHKLKIGQNKRDQTLIKQLKERNKRHSSIENRAKTPLLSHNIANFWNTNFHNNVRETRRQRHLAKHSIGNLSIVTVTEEINTANTFILNKTTDEKNEANDKEEVALETDTLNHNLNDLFKLLGGLKTVEMNKGEFELESTTKNNNTFSSKKKVYNQTLTPLSNTKKFENTKKPNNSSTNSKIKTKTDQTNKQLCIINEKRKTTRNISSKTSKPKTQHTTIVLTGKTKVGFLNRLVGVTLKFLGKKENKEKPTSKPNYVEKRPISKIFHKCKKKFATNAETKPSKGDDIIHENNNVTTSRNPTIIIIDDFDFTEKSTTTIKSNNNAMTRKLLLNTNKKTSLKLLEETKSADLSENKRNTTELVSSLMPLVHIENSNNNITQNNIKYPDHDIIHSITKGLSLTATNLTTLRPGKYALNKIFYKISGKSTPSAKKSELNEKDNNQRNISLDVWANRTMLNKPIKSENNIKTTLRTTHDTESENRVTKLNVTKIIPTKKKLDTCYFESKSLKEAGEDGFDHICDISTTVAFVTKLQKSILNHNFENYVKNIPCHKYKRAPKYFTIRSCIRKPSKMLQKRLHQLKFLGNMRGNRFRKWDWIRDKRTVNDETRVEDDTEEGCKHKPLRLFSNYLSGTRKQKKNSDFNGNFIQLLDGENDYYENFIRGKDGIYGKSLKRRKRLDADMSELNEGLQNLPPLRPSIDEIYAMLAESITFDCNTSESTKNRYSNYIWTTDRVGLLDYKNVIVDGSKVYIKNVQTNNSGNYLCNTDNAIIRNIKLTVIELPTIDIVFTPLYEIESCSYENLKNLQKLGKLMSLFTCKKECSARIDEPICLKDSMDGSILIRPIVVMSVKRQANINCSAKCERDFHCSKALLLAKNAPALASVKVLIYDNDTKRILFPLREKRRSFVTHTLRQKDANGHREYHSLAANMDPNSVNVVLLCSAGFYLVVGQKICAVCPPNTFSLEGENVCRNCPKGSSSEPGSRSCRLSLHSRKYRCPWKYECGAAVCMLSCVIACCYTVLRLLRQPVSAKEIKTSRKTRQGFSNINHEKKQKCRPLSPSRVILSRLLQASFSSSRATGKNIGFSRDPI